MTSWPGRINQDLLGEAADTRRKHEPAPKMQDDTAVQSGAAQLKELQSVSRVPAVKANAWLGNDLSAKAVGKFSWGFWWLCL